MELLFEEAVWRFFGKLNTQNQIPCDPAILLLCPYLNGLELGTKQKFHIVYSTVHKPTDEVGKPDVVCAHMEY